MGETATLTGQQSHTSINYSGEHKASCACHQVCLPRACRRLPRKFTLTLAVCLAAGLLLAACQTSAAMSDDDGVSINIRRSSGANNFQPSTVGSAAKRLPPGKKRDTAIKEKKSLSLKKAPTAVGKVKVPRPTAETFGDNFSGLGKSKNVAAKKHGDGGVTLAAADAGERESGETERESA